MLSPSRTQLSGPRFPSLSILCFNGLAGILLPKSPRIDRKWDSPSHLRTSAARSLSPVTLDRAGRTSGRPAFLSLLGRRYLHPGRVLARGFQDSRDETNSFYAVLHFRYKQRCGHRSAPGVPCSDLLCQVRIKLRERLQISLGVPGRDAARLLHRRRCPSPGPADRYRRLPIRSKPQIIRILLPPLDSRLLPINPQAQVVLVSGSHLARPQHSSRAALKSQEHLYVVIEPPPRHKNGHVGRHLIAAQSRHKTRDVISVRSDIPQGTRRSALRGIGAPNGLFLPSSLNRGGQPVLRVLHLHEANSPKFPPLNHLSSLPHQGIPRVVMRQPKNQPAAPDDLRQRQRIFHRCGQRLVADDVNARLQERFRRLEMKMIGRDD